MRCSRRCLIVRRDQRLALRPRRTFAGQTRVHRGVPAGTTLWRLLIRLDATLVSTVLAGWLHARTPPAVTRSRRYRTVIAIDGKTLRGARLPGGRQTHLLSALDTSTGIILAQVTVNTKATRSPPSHRCSTPSKSIGQPDRDRVRRRRPAHPDRSRPADHRPRSTSAPASKGQPSPPCSSSSSPCPGHRSRSAAAPATPVTPVKRPGPSRPSPCTRLPARSDHAGRGAVRLHRGNFRQGRRGGIRAQSSDVVPRLVTPPRQDRRTASALS